MVRFQVAVDKVDQLFDWFAVAVRIPSNSVTLLAIEEHHLPIHAALAYYAGRRLYVQFIFISNSSLNPVLRENPLAFP